MGTIQPPAQQRPRDMTFEIGHFAGNAAIEAIREQKPQVFAQIQDYYDATVQPADPGNVSLAERALIAHRVAAGIPDAALADWYRTIIDALNETVDESTPRLTAILARIALVNANPNQTASDDVRALQDAGLTEIDIISISQLIAFVHYQARLLVGLKALGATS
jgi:uncharacterized protein YciW